MEKSAARLSERRGEPQRQIVELDGVHRCSLESACPSAVSCDIIQAW